MGFHCLMPFRCFCMYLIYRCLAGFGKSENLGIGSTARLLTYFWRKIGVMKIKQDHLKHFSVCLAVAFSASSIEAGFGASYGQSFVAGIIAGGAIGVGKEYGDKCAPGNKWDWSDIAADIAGSIVGSAIGSLFSLINH